MISYSTCGFLDRDVEAALDAIADAGFTHAEIIGQDPHVGNPPQGQQLHEFRARLETRGLTRGTVHAPLRRNVLGAPEEEWRREKVEVLGSYLRFTGAIGYQAMIVHPVPNPIFVPNPNRPELRQLIADAVRHSLDELIPVARESGVIMFARKFTLRMRLSISDHGRTTATRRRISRGRGWVGARYGDTRGQSDTTRPSQIRIAGERLGGTHLQDVDGANPQDNHWLPGHGDLNWTEIRTALEGIGYAGFVDFRSYCATTRRIAGRTGKTRTGVRYPVGTGGG